MAVSQEAHSDAPSLDAVVVGAGFAGMAYLEDDQLETAEPEVEAEAEVAVKGYEGFRLSGSRRCG